VSTEIAEPVPEVIPSYKSIDGLPETRLRALTREYGEAAATEKLAKERKAELSKEIHSIVAALGAPKSIDVEGYRVTQCEGQRRKSLDVDSLIRAGVSKRTIELATKVTQGEAYVTVTPPKQERLL
jgi:hypothetical protein